MDTVLQTIGLVAIALAVVGLVVTLVFIRRETRVRARWDVLRLLLGAATLVVFGLIAGAALQPAVVVAIAALGLALGLVQGSALRVRVAGKSVYVRRDGVGILLWGIGVVLASGGGLASSLGILALGHLVGWFGVGMQGGQLVGRVRAVRRAVAAVAPTIAAVVVASWLTLDAGGSVTVAADFVCPDSLDGLPLNPRISGPGEGPYGEFICYYNPADFSVWSSASANWIPTDADQITIDSLAGGSGGYCERTDEAYEDANRPQELYGWVFPVAGERMVLGAYEGDTGGASVASLQALARSMAEAKADEAAVCPNASGGGAADFACPDSLDGLTLGHNSGPGAGPFGDFKCSYYPADLSLLSFAQVQWIPIGTDEVTVSNMAVNFCERAEEAVEDPGRPQELYGWVVPFPGERMVLGHYQGDTGGASVASLQALARSMAEAKADEAAACPGASAGGSTTSPPSDGSGSPTSGSPTEEDGVLAALADAVVSGETPDPGAALISTVLAALGVGGTVATAIAEVGRRGRRTSVTLTGDAARAALAAGVGGPIEIPDDQRWGVHVRAGNQVGSSDFLGERGRISGIPVVVQGEGGEIAVSVDVDIEPAAPAPTPAPVADTAADVAVPSPEPMTPPEPPTPAEPPVPAEPEVTPSRSESDAAPPVAAGPPVEPTPAVGPTPSAESGQPGAVADASVPGSQIDQIRTEIEQRFGADGVAAASPILDRAEALRADGGGTMTVSAEEVAALAGLDAQERIEGISFHNGYVIVHATGSPPIPFHPTVDPATGRVGVEFGTGGLDSALLDPLARQVAAKLGVDPDKLLDGLNDMIRRTGLQPERITISEAGFAVDTTESPGSG